jgi:hypothetical protein
MATLVRGKSSNKAIISSYNDPLIELLHAPDLNKDKDLSNTLVEYIDEISDNELKQWCIDSLTVLRDLEKIETQLNQWEFHTLDFTIEVHNHYQENLNKDSNNKSIQDKLAKRVLEKSTSIRELLSNLKPDISKSVGRARNLSKTNPAKVITDAGTILIELTMRIVKMAKHLDEQVTIGYSRAKLAIIGSELKKLVTLDPFLIDKEVVKNYKIFVNNLLNQLNNAVANKDTVALWESVAIVGDIEKMFESMKRKAMSEKIIEKEKKMKENITKPKMKSSVYHEDISSASTNCSNPSVLSNATDSTLVDEESLKVTTNSKISAKEIFNNDNDLIRTKISDHIPELMNAFQSVKQQNIEKSEGKKQEKENEAPLDIDTQATPGISSFFNPSILNAFYQPKLKEPIYIHKSKLSISESNDDNTTVRREQLTTGNDKLLTNASIAVRLDRISQESEAQSNLLEKEREIKGKEILMEKSMNKSPRPLTSTSPILQQVSTTLLSKSLLHNAIDGSNRK